MSKLSDEKILRHLSAGISHLTPENTDELWNMPVQQAAGDEWYLETQRKTRKQATKRYYLGTVAACLVLCICASFLFPLLTSASVYLDVNPSISLSVNYHNRVTGVTACNADAEKVLGDLDFRGTDLNVALYAILGSMVHNGYLTESKDTILVSVSCANAGRAAQLEQEVSGMVTDSLQNMISAGEVLSHQVDSRESEDPVSSCTPGKTAFIQDLEDRYPQLKEDALEDLTIDEIVLILKDENLDYSDYTDDGSDEDEDEEDNENDDDDEEDEEDDDDEEDEDDEDDG